MTNQEKLIRFMKGKASLLSEAVGVPSELYFSKDDEECLYRLDDHRALMIWRSLKLAICTKKIEGLGVSTCPFCLIYHIDCERCYYAKQHGKCRSGGHYTRIIETLSEKYESPKELLTNEFYVNLLKSIEKEDVKCQTNQQ